MLLLNLEPRKMEDHIHYHLVPASPAQDLSKQYEFIVNTPLFQSGEYRQLGRIEMEVI